jgi:hypothetical protein
MIEYCSFSKGSPFEVLAAVHEFSVMDTSNAPQDPILLETEISEAWTKLALKRRQSHHMNSHSRGSAGYLILRAALGEGWDVNCSRASSKPNDVTSNHQLSRVPTPACVPPAKNTTTCAAIYRQQFVNHSVANV